MVAPGRLSSKFSTETPNGVVQLGGHFPHSLQTVHDAKTAQYDTQLQDGRNWTTVIAFQHRSAVESCNQMDIFPMIPKLYLTPEQLNMTHNRNIVALGRLTVITIQH